MYFKGVSEPHCFSPSIAVTSPSSSVLLTEPCGRNEPCVPGCHPGVTHVPPGLSSGLSPGLSPGSGSYQDLLCCSPGTSLPLLVCIPLNSGQGKLPNAQTVSGVLIPVVGVEEVLGRAQLLELPAWPLSCALTAGPEAAAFLNHVHPCLHTLVKCS